MSNYINIDNNIEVNVKGAWPPKEGYYTVIPQSWRFAPEMKTKSESRAKFNEVAATLLSDLLYWYSPKEDGSKRFKGRLWQTSYDNWGCRWDYSRDVVKDAVKFLVAAGLIKTTVAETAVINGKVRPNVMYVQPMREAIERITYIVSDDTIYARKNKQNYGQVSGPTDPHTLSSSADGGLQTPIYQGLQTPIPSGSTDPDITKSSCTQNSDTKNRIKEDLNFLENCDAPQPSNQEDLGRPAAYQTSSLEIENPNQKETSNDLAELVNEQTKKEVGLKSGINKPGNPTSDQLTQKQNLDPPPPAPPAPTSPIRPDTTAERKVAFAIGKECGIKMDYNDTADVKHRKAACAIAKIFVKHNVPAEKIPDVATKAKREFGKSELRPADFEKMLKLQKERNASEALRRKSETFFQCACDDPKNWEPANQELDGVVKLRCRHCQRTRYVAPYSPAHLHYKQTRKGAWEKTSKELSQ